MTLAETLALRPFHPLKDLALACALLTRIPVPVDPGFAASRGARAAWAYPLAGALVAALAGAAALGAARLGVPATLIAGLAIALQVVLSGGMHEDGLADAADGLWGGWTRERRLEIMKDSRIGSYGVLAIVLAIGLRWSALTALAPDLLAAMLAAALLSRAAMVAVMATLPNAREGGLSRGVGRPSAGTAMAAALIAGLGGLALLGPAILVTALAAALAGLACALIAYRKIGGQTGDILGAVQQISEIAVLVAATITLA